MDSLKIHSSRLYGGNAEGQNWKSQQPKSMKKGLFWETHWALNRLLFTMPKGTGFASNHTPLLIQAQPQGRNLEGLVLFFKRIPYSINLTFCATFIVKKSEQWRKAREVSFLTYHMWEPKSALTQMEKKGIKRGRPGKSVCRQSTIQTQAFLFQIWNIIGILFLEDGSVSPLKKPPAYFQLKKN